MQCKMQAVAGQQLRIQSKIVRFECIFRICRKLCTYINAKRGRRKPGIENSMTNSKNWIYIQCMYNGHQKEEGMRDNMRCRHAWMHTLKHTKLPMYVCTYICTHGEIQNANCCWSATCSCLSTTQVMHIFTCTYDYQENYRKKLQIVSNMYVHMYICTYIHTYIHAYIHTYIHVCTLNIPTYVYVCTCLCIYVHMCTWRNAQCKWLLVSNMQLLVSNTSYACTYIFTCTCGYQQNYVLETKNGKTHQIHIHMYMYVCSYVYVVCFPHFPVQHLQKYVCHISQIMYAMKNALRNAKIMQWRFMHLLWMYVLLSRPDPPPNRHFFL